MTSFPLRHRSLLIHRWIGMALTIPLLLATLAGMALIWREPLDRLTHPRRYAVTGARLLPLDAYVTELRSGERVASLTLPTAGGPVSAITQAGTAIYLDPPTARILDIAPAASTLRSTLLAGKGGRAAATLVGIALLLSLLTGLWLWRPTAGGWAHGLRWRRRPERGANLHHLLGLLATPPLAWLALTGVWLGITMSPEPPPDASRPLAHTGLSAHEAAVRALAVAPGPVRELTWPTERTPDWHVRLASRTVSVADDSPTPIAVAEQAAERGIAGAIRQGGGGPFERTLLSLAGLAAAVLAVTGLMMWRRGPSA